MEEPADRPQIRFEAVFSARAEEVLEAIRTLDLDWLPAAADGQMRALVMADDIPRILERGMEVRLVRAYPIRPLDPALVMDDESAQRWLEEATRWVERDAGQ